MFALIGQLLGLGPMVAGIFKAKFDAQVAITQARVGGDRDLAVELVKGQAARRASDVTALAIFAGNKVLLALLCLYAVPPGLFAAKVYLYDKMLGLGSTDPISGAVADWTLIVLGFLFGTSALTSMVQTWASRKAP